MEAYGDQSYCGREDNDSISSRDRYLTSDPGATCDPVDSLIRPQSLTIVPAKAK